MNSRLLQILVVTAFICPVSSCSISKQSTVSKKDTSANSPNTNITNGNNFLLLPPISDNVLPGKEELMAIQKQYRTVTLQQLTTGYTIYTSGACINCHQAQPIKKFEPEQWKTILDDMALRSNLNAEEKDAVHKYVLSIKAKQTQE